MLPGVAPDRAEVEYGWIEPGRPLISCAGHPVRAARRFLEKPDEARAMDAMTAGALWNTLVLGSRLETLWTLGWRCFPELLPLFEQVERTCRDFGALPPLGPVYARMPRRNFSSGLLERVPERVALVQAEEIMWCDWGKPARVADTLLRLGKQPAFPLECVA